jgi:hypothetical protein
MIGAYSDLATREEVSERLDKLRHGKEDGDA